jgi:uncharacterized caspase-like protein
MIAALAEFKSRAADADWAVIYFAGYAADIGGVAHLAPIDAKVPFSPATMIELGQLAKQIDRARKLSLVILDASNDIPSAAAKGSLPAIDLDGPTVVATAAKHGTLALPTDARNSRYAVALAEGMLMPRLDMRLMFRRVRDGVRNATNNQQEPYLYGNPGGGTYYFRPLAP